MDKIDKLIEEVGNKFADEKDDIAIHVYGGKIITFERCHRLFGTHICTVGEYKERLDLKTEDKAWSDFSKEFDPIMEKAECKQQLLETYTGLAMQALIARGECINSVREMTADYAKAAIESMSDSND